MKLHTPNTLAGSQRLAPSFPRLKLTSLVDRRMCGVLCSSSVSSSTWSSLVRSHLLRRQSQNARAHSLAHLKRRRNLSAPYVVCSRGPFQSDGDRDSGRRKNIRCDARRRRVTWHFLPRFRGVRWMSYRKRKTWGQTGHIGLCGQSVSRTTFTMSTL